MWEYISVFESMNEWHKELHSGGHLLLYREYSYPPRSPKYFTYVVEYGDVDEDPEKRI